MVPFSSFRRRLAWVVPAVLALLLAPVPLPAQVSASSMPLDAGFGPLDPSPPALPVAQIIQEFTAKEAVFKQALDNYTWTRSVRVQSLDDDGQVNGQYYQVTDIGYDTEGHRTERVIDAPEAKLFDTSCDSDDTTTCNGEIMMTERDFSDIEERLPFVLTTEDASQYNITYLGKQKIDQIDTWVFDVKPKVLEKNHRYFQGRIWVDQREHQIVVTDGKNVPDDLRPNHMDLTLPFITYRQMVDGKYWFPVYTHGDAVLHFAAGHGYLSDNAHLREMVKYTNYHEFHTSIRVIYKGQDITGNPQKQPGQQGATPPSGGGQNPPPSKPQ